ARSLNLRVLFGEAEDELPIVLFPLLGLLVRFLEPLELEKSRDLPQLRGRLAIRRGELAESAPVFLGEELHETRAVVRPFFEDLPCAAAVRELGVPLDHAPQDHLVGLTLVPELAGHLACCSDSARTGSRSTIAVLQRFTNSPSRSST